MKIVPSIYYATNEGKGKSSRSALVPILFTVDVVKGIGVILKYRGKFVKETNNLLLATGGDTAYTGWDTLQHITKLIPSLEKPKLITPTRTRKFLATLLQLMNLTDGEINWVTSHMGHTRGVHFQWYRKVKFGYFLQNSFLIFDKDIKDV